MVPKALDVVYKQQGGDYTTYTTSSLSNNKKGMRCIVKGFTRKIGYSIPQFRKVWYSVRKVMVSST
jgi:hypothetical protein